MAKKSAKQADGPLMGPSVHLPELTFRAIVLAIILAVILAASNAYLALKIGTTVAASIPASVLALGVLRFFKNSNVLESNLAQTAASAGEGMAGAVSFVLPAMLVLHVWTEFPYWKTFLVSVTGGLLGVLFSIPLRRILLNMPTLTFPEGTAVGNVLRSAVNKGSSLKWLVQGGAVGALVSFCQSGFKIFSDNVQIWTLTSRTLFGMGFGFTPATLAAGYIIGPQVGVTLFIGVIIGWVILLPWIGLFEGVPTDLSAYDAAMVLWSDHLRFVGVGTMLVGGVWCLIRLMPDVWEGLRLSMRSFSLMGRQKTLVRTEQDIPWR